MGLVGETAKEGNNQQMGKLLVVTIGASFAFWLWSNFGVWLMAGIYAPTWDGFIACYVAAIPFLRNAMIGDLVWTGVLFYSFRFMQRLADSHRVVSQN